MAINVQNLVLKTLYGSDRQMIAEWNAPLGPAAKTKVTYRAKKNGKLLKKYIDVDGYAGLTTGYKVQWFQVKDGVTVLEAEGDAVGTSAEFDADEAATMVGIKVTPVAKRLDTYVSGKKTTKPYYEAGTAQAVIVFGQEDVQAVEPPEVDVDGVTITVECEAEDADVNTIVVHLTADGAAEQVVSVPKTGKGATVTFVVAPGSMCSAYFEAVTADGIGYTSPPSEMVQAVPEVPIIESLAFDQGSGTASITWSECAGVDEYSVQWATDAAYFASNPSAVKSMDGIESETALITELEGGTGFYFRVQATNESGDSGWSAISDMLQVGTAPLAPMTYQSGDLLFRDENEAVVLSWVHNPTDGSEQTEAMVQYRYEGEDGTWNAPIHGGEQSMVYSILPSDPETGGYLEWRVRTWGFVTGAGGAGEWSDWKRIYVASTRECAIETAPFVVSGGSESITVKPADENCTDFTSSCSIVSLSDYEITDKRGDVRRIHAGDVLWSDVANGEHQFNLGDVPFGQGHEFEVRGAVYVNMGDGVAWRSRGVAPYGRTLQQSGTPNRAVATADGLTMRFSFPLTPTKPTTIYRVNPDGSKVEVGNLDEYAPFNVFNYIVSNYGDDGAAVIRPIDGAPIACDSVVIDFAGHQLMLPYDINITHSVAPADEYVAFAGATQAAGYIDTALNSSMSVSLDIQKSDMETMMLVRQLQSVRQCHVRTPVGDSFDAVASVTVNPSYDSAAVPVSIEFREVR